MSKYLYIAFFLFFATSCDKFSYTKEQYLKDFGDFVERVKNEQKNYTENNWQSADAEFEEYSVVTFEQFGNELTKDEIAKVNELRGKYTAYRTVQEAKDVVKEIQQGVENFKEQTKGFMKGIEEMSKDSSKSD